MTAGELIRSARSRAALAQQDLADRLGVPRSQIGRWENGDVEPAFATVRRVLRTCGFDLSTALVPYDPDAPEVARVVELSRLTPKERLDAALLRGGHRRLGYTFDPYKVLDQLDETGVEYILVGSLARVLHGADEIPENLDLVIPKGTRVAAEEAISTFAMRAPPGVERDSEAWSYWSRLGNIATRELPAGTRGHRDLRRRAERVHLGGGLRPWVASPGDLVRMMEALGRPEQAQELEAMRRVVELDQRWDPPR
jgi:transcriptional regulator with XRE-family HTH domain